MGITFDAPLALLLLVPALVAHGRAAPPRRAAADRLRPAARRARRSGSLLLAALVFALAGFQLVLPVDRLATVFVVDLSDSVGNAGPRGGARLPARDAQGASPTSDVAGIVAFGSDALVERLPSELAEIDRIASTPVKSRDRHRRRAAAGHRAVPRRRPEADRPPLRRQRHDRRAARPRRRSPRRAASRSRPGAIGPRRRRRGPRRAADDAVDGPPRRVDPGRRPTSRSTVAQTGDGPPVRRRRRSSRPSRSSSTAGPTRVTFDVKPTEAGFHTLPGRRRGRRATRSARTTAPTRTRSSRASRGSLVLAGDDDGRRRARRGAQDRAPAGRHDHPRGAADRLRGPRRLRPRRPRRRARGCA